MCTVLTFLIHCTVLLLISAPCSAKIFTLQSDLQRNKENHPVWDLAGASDGKAVLLAPSRTLSINFCLREDSDVAINDVRVSNGNRSESVFIDIDETPMGTFRTFEGHGWNDFMSTGVIASVPLLRVGWHYLKVKINGSADGVAIDKIDIFVRDEKLTEAIFSCELSCLPDQRFKLRDNDVLTEMSFMVQESYKTNCSEVDNINIPIFNTNIEEYEITAALPRYRTFSNWRGENTTACPHLSPIYWRFDNLALSTKSKSHPTIRKDKVIMHFTDGNDLYSKISLQLIPMFKLEGKSKGMVDSEMGTILRMGFKGLRSNVRVSMRFKGRNPMSKSNVKLLSPNNPKVEWNSPDFTWTDADYNLVFLVIDSNSSEPLVLDYLYLERRPWLPDQIKTIYKDDNVIVEGVFSDFWWLAPDLMTIHLSIGDVFHNTSYFRVYRPIAWNSGYAQVFVLYQDGNARLLPVPPEGVDWIPFGSSVIIGQTDPTVVRPYASITDVWVDLDKFVFDVRYKNGGTSKLTLICTLSETRVIVSDIYFRGNPAFYPFTTFRSMWVAEGNTDVDHVSVNGQYSKHIMADFGYEVGRSFIFHRKCMSHHLNLSPDIYIDIRRTKNNVPKADLLHSSSFMLLLQRIQEHRHRLWTPRLRYHY